MVEPLLQIFTDRARPRRFGTQPAVGWRLIAANRREVGRSSRVFAHADDAVTNFRRVAAESRAGLLRPILLYGGAGGGWRWTLSADSDEVARSHRAYSRRRECAAPLERFLLQLASATGELRVVALPDLPRQRVARPCSPPARPTTVVDLRSRRGPGLPAAPSKAPVVPLVPASVAFDAAVVVIDLCDPGSPGGAVAEAAVPVLFVRRSSAQHVRVV